MVADSINDMVAATIVFVVASFLANFGNAVTGFGMPLLFWFVYTIGDISGFMKCSLCGVKEAAFFQALSLGSVAPLLLWQSRQDIRKHADKLLLTAFIPATIIGTPVGQLLQKIVRAEVIRLVVGSLILLISAFELFRLIKSRNTTAPSTNNKPGVPADNEVDLEKASPCPNTEPTLRDEEESDRQDTLDHIEVEKDAICFVPNHASGSKFWGLGFALGFLSGFLGGLTGIRSGPILIFFLHFNYPKQIIRSNIMILSCLNTYVRVVYYFIEHFTESNSVVWFQKDYIYVYVCVIIAGLLGVPLGSWVEPKVNQVQYNSIIIIALVIVGFMSIIKGSIDIS